MKARKEYMQLLANIEEAKDILSNESDADMREMAKEEMDNSQERLPVLEEEIKLLLVPADPQDGKNAILEIRGGTGGDEAAIFAGDLSGCTPNSVKRKVGKWKYPVPMKALPADIRRSFAALQAIMYTVH